MASGVIQDTRPKVIAIVAFFVALALRTLNAPLAFDHGRPQLSPVDELYHWKRISWSATHFPQVLEFDPDRRAFCPWPPLYDLVAGGATRLLGARDADSVLRRVVWFPPLLAAAFVAIASFVIARHFGALAAIAATLALAASPFLVTQSSIGNIDHHFLEWPLAFALLGAAASRRGVLLGLALIAALFVQTALIIAAALAFVVLFIFNGGRAGTIGFANAAIAVALYRITRGAGYPNGPWFLGWPHVALLAGAAIVLGAAFWVPRANSQANSTQHSARSTIGWAVICGAAIAALALPSVIEGSHFLAGDPWLRTIIEFQPIWKARGADLLSLLVGLGAGAILVWPLAFRRGGFPIALFAIVYLLLTLSSRRFWSVGIPLLALAGAVYASMIRARLLRIIALAAVALPPPIQLALWMQHPTPPVGATERQWIRAAEFLRTQPGGRVLAPWWLGHTIDVIGGHGVVIDNFGNMPDPLAFERANEALLSRDEATLVRYCQTNGVRFVLLTNPLLGVRDAAAVIGARANPGTATWWWRTYFSRRAEHYRLIYDNWRPEWQGAWMVHAPAIEIWELDVREHR
jgi:asparagine N-glycosylation enzyme membrane subunit Stt3